MAGDAPSKENDRVNEQPSSTTPDVQSPVMDEVNQERDRQSTSGSKSEVVGAAPAQNPSPTGIDLTDPFKALNRDNIEKMWTALGFGKKENGSESPEGKKEADKASDAPLANFVSPDSCTVCKVPKDQTGKLPQQLTSDIDNKFKHKSGDGADVKLKELSEEEKAKDGADLERKTTIKAKDGSTLTVTSREQYVRDEKGNIVEEDGHKMTRVLSEEKEAKDKNNKVTFHSDTKNTYNKDGDLEDSKTDLKRLDTKGNLSNYNSFHVHNDFDKETGRLVGQKSEVLGAPDKKGHQQALQTAEAKYGYDKDGNLTSEDIVRHTGKNKIGHEHHEHQYKQFGTDNEGNPRFERTETNSQLFDRHNNPNGTVKTEYFHDDKGNLQGETTVEKDKHGRETHVFDAAYAEDGSRWWSKDTHKTYHANGNEKSITESEFNAIGDSTSRRIEKDEKGNEIPERERSITQHDDGSITGKNGKLLLTADQGAALGGYWDKETAWNSLERLSGDATNRDVLSGWNQLGKFAGGKGHEAEAIAKLEKWGQGDATVGIDILEKNWGNGDGRAAQGMDTYLSMGAGAAMSKAKDKATQAWDSTVAAVSSLINPNAPKGSTWAHLTDAAKQLKEASDAALSSHAEAERLREKIHTDAGVSGDLVGVCGNGDHDEAICQFKKQGDEGQPAKPGQSESPIERAIDAMLKWSPSGSFGDAVRTNSDIAGGDMLKITDIRQQMGTTQRFENGQVVTEVSALNGNDTMLGLGATSTARVITGEDGKQVAVGVDGKPLMGADGKPVPVSADGKPLAVDAEGKPMMGADGQQMLIGLDGKPIAASSTQVNPELAADQFKRAGVTPNGYDGMVAAKNFYEAGVTTAMTTDAQGRPVPVIDATTGMAVYLHSAEKAVEAVKTMGGGSPVTGMDVMTELSSKKDAEGKTVSLDMRVGFEQLPKIGETLTATEGGKTVAVRDVAISAQTVLNFGEPAKDASGNPIPVLDASGKVIPQGVVGAQALLETTRTKEGTDAANIYTSLQTVTSNERAMFSAAVADGRVEPGKTFSAAETTRETLQIIGRQDGQVSGSALEGARIVTGEQKATDGRSFNISPDGTFVGGMTAIRNADSAPAGQQTVRGGALEISLFQARQEGQTGLEVRRDGMGGAYLVDTKKLDASGQPTRVETAASTPTFIGGAQQTAAMADRNDASTGRPLESTQLFTNGVTNVQSYSKDGTFAGGRETVAYIGGGSTRPDAIPAGVREIRTAADTTTGGSVSQMAAVTTAAGNGDPRVGAESMMTYRDRNNTTAGGSYSSGAEKLYTDLYGSPNAPQNAGRTMQATDVERAVSLASAPEVRPAGTSALQSGMDKTNEIVRASGNPDLTGSSVLTNLANNPTQMEVVRQAATPQEAHAKLVEQGAFEKITTPVVTTTNAPATTTVAATEAAKVEAARLAKEKEESTLVGNAPVANRVAATEPVRAEVAPAAVNNQVVRSTETVARETNVAATSKDVAPVVAASGKEVTPVVGRPATETSVGKVEVAKAEVKEVKANNDNASVTRIVAAAASTNGQTSSAKPEFVAFQNLNKTLGGQSGMFMANAGERVVSSLQSIIANNKSLTDAAAKAASVALNVAAPMNTSKPVIAESAQRTALQGSVSVNVATGNANLAKASASSTVSVSDVVRTARQGDISAIRTAGTSSIIGDGRVQPLRSAGSIDSTMTASNSRSMDLMIARTLRAGGFNIIEGDLKIAKSKLNKKFRRLGEDDLALFGAEIALAALLVSASIAKEKADKAEAKKKGALGGGEFAKESAGEGAEFDNDDNANKEGQYKIFTRPTWLVRPGEDLVKLAEHLFHEAELGWLIADLNMGQTKESYMDGKRIVELKARQRIDLPVWQDIVEFHKRRTENATPENLVTIVNENEIDTELMEATLGVAMGTTSSAPAPVAAVAKVKTALVVAGVAPVAKEGERSPLLASAKRAALVVRNAASAASAAVAKDQDQGPTAPAVATVEELKPKYV